jgi:topoisomerase IA-like protein
LRRLKEELNQTRQLVEESSRSVYQGIETLADSERTGNAISQPERKKAKKKKTASKKTASRKIAHKKSSKKAKSKKAAKKKTAKRAPRKG